MLNSGWRTVIVDGKATVSFSEGCLVVDGDVKKTIPLEQMGVLMVIPIGVTLSARLIAETAKKGIKIIFCDEKYNPVCETVSSRENSESSGILFDQLSWEDQIRQNVWQGIVRLKIRSQAENLSVCGREIPSEMLLYERAVEPGDVTNREGQAARVYFPRLFGADFIRGADTEENAALNYGYTILLSAVNRIVTLHGYDLRLGIKHCGRHNPFNLSCDLMEPFRPFVDRKVFLNTGRFLDREYKKELTSLLYCDIIYNKEKMQLYNAVDRFASEIFRELEGEKITEKELRLF